MDDRRERLQMMIDGETISSLCLIDRNVLMWAMAEIKAKDDLLAALKTFDATWQLYVEDSTNDLIDAIEASVRPKILAAIAGAEGRQPAHGDQR